MCQSAKISGSLVLCKLLQFVRRIIQLLAVELAADSAAYICFNLFLTVDSDSKLLVGMPSVAKMLRMQSQNN